MEVTSHLFASRGGKTDYKEVDFHHTKLKEACPKLEGGLLLPPVAIPPSHPQSGGHWKATPWALGS